MPVAKTWMDLETIILSGERHIKSERKTDIILYRLYVESKLAKSQKQRAEGMYQGFGSMREGEVVVKGNKVLCRICKF